jgi:hypothetical protein
MVVKKSSIFWNRSACYLLHAGFLLDYSLTLKMETTFFLQDGG